MPTKKILNISLIIVAFFLYLVASNFTETLLTWLNKPSHLFDITDDFLVTWGDVAGVLVAVFGVVFVKSRSSWVEFFTQSIEQLKQVIYPTPEEAGKSALIVILMAGLATVFLALFDLIWKGVVERVMFFG